MAADEIQKVRTARCGILSEPLGGERPGENGGEDKGAFRYGISYGIRRAPTENAAIERAMLEERVRGIHAAISHIPDGYRSYVLSNIIMKNSGKTFPNKVWRIWKQRFLYDVAVNLAIL